MGSPPHPPDGEDGRPATSVVLCTCDGARHLPELLESLAEQTRPPSELVVRDDASADATPRLLEDFARDAPFPVRALEGDERLGPRRNFERGIEAARGALIFLADQDDRWRPGKIERLAELFAGRPDLGYAFSDAELIDEDGAPTGERFWEAAGLTDDLPDRFGPDRQFGCLLKRGLAPGAALAFRAEIREVALPIPAEWAHDWWLMAVASGAGWLGRAVAEPLLRYRLHPGQATGLRRPERPAGLLARYRRHRRRLATQVERHEGRLARLERLRERLEDRLPDGPPAEVEAELERETAEEADRVAHVRARARVRNGPTPGALSALIRELRRGRYRRHSGSVWSAAADAWARVAPDR